MSRFSQKQFQGKLYEFSHLTPAVHTVPLNAAGTFSVRLQVSYSIHCFTEDFNPLLHQDHHRYSYGSETRAFDVVRYDCSLQLKRTGQRKRRRSAFSRNTSRLFLCELLLPLLTARPLGGSTSVLHSLSERLGMNSRPS